MKKRYRITNWPEYNRALVERGSLTVWFSEDAIKKWCSDHHTCRPGRPYIYSEDAILCALMIRTVYHLPLRALMGFLLGLVTLLSLAIPVPSYTQICRRAAKLQKTLKRLSNRRPSDLVFDSTGLKVYGEGEWKVKVHGKSKRRTWRKLHICIDPKTGEILMQELTENSVGDAEVAQKMLRNLPRLTGKVYGDGSYDSHEFRAEVERRGAKPIVPVRRNAVVNREHLRSRNDSVYEVAGLGGAETARRLWKVLTGYHTRSLVETSMYRIKTITGGELRSRIMGNQQAESYVKCMIINRMNGIGMPVGVWE